MAKLDDLDRKILKALQQDATVSMDALAKQIGFIENTGLVTHTENAQGGCHSTPGGAGGSRSGRS